MTAIGPFAIAILFALGLAAAIMLLVFVLVPLLKGIGWAIAAIFQGIGWLVRHVFEFIVGMIGDTIRFLGAIIASIVLMPMALLSIVVGRWSAAGHYANSVKREWNVAGACLYRVVLRRPLKLVMLHGLLEGLEQRVPEAVAGAPTADRPSRRTGQFDGFRIVGSLKSGGSGAKLYVAEPDEERCRAGMPERVVIKSFTFSEGSTLPQIVRESRALECAKQLGLVLEHGMDASRFFYVMPYHQGDHLGIITRQLHGESDRGLRGAKLSTALRYVRDLVATLHTYHDGGLWHKDVKPENIIILDDGSAQLVDLGLITPLRSAMTLTTHGTEYFRDPELVRQALRGVKVHQVNGAKFDVFAAGAVLYFVLENTFPPHGALSRFTDRSPDALRWIVRRAMADYTHRYGSAEEMLVDLAYVSSAPDPALVKPADLPSVRGAGSDSVEDLLADDAPAAPAGVPHTPRPAAGARVAAPASPRPSMRPATRPALRITNWWTGEYGVAPAVDSGRASAVQAAARDARAHAAQYRTEVQEIGRKLSGGAMTARQASRAQIRAARQRAQAIRRSARNHAKTARRVRANAPARAIAERQPSPTLVAIGAVGVIFIVALCGLAFATLSPMTPSRMAWSGPAPTVSVSSGTGRMMVTSDAAQPGRPVLVVNDLPAGHDPEALEKVMETYARQGYDVLLDDQIAAEVAPVLVSWERTKTNANDKALEDLLEAHDLFGVLRVSGNARRGSGSLVWSTRRGAENRRLAVDVPAPPLAPAAPAGPYLVVNDHPTKHDEQAQSSIAETLARFAEGGFVLVLDDDSAEVDVRKAMPGIPGDGIIEMTDRLRTALESHGYGGVIYIDAASGDGPARERVRTRTIDMPG